MGEGSTPGGNSYWEGGGGDRAKVVLGGGASPRGKVILGWGIPPG